jgi:hypothetical protein
MTRGKIDFDQVRDAARNGAGSKFQMSDGTFTAGNAPAYDATGTLIDSGAPPGGGSTFVDDETPSGTLNGSNVTFTLAHAPSPAGSLRLYQNGTLAYRGTDYTLSSLTITFTDAPSADALLRAWYRY